MSESLMESSEAPAAEEQRDFVVAEDSQPERPDWLPEKYSSGEDLAKAYKELESKLGGKEEDIRNKLLEEIQTEAFSDRPDSSGDYQLPDIVNDDLAVDNKLLQWWSEHSFENGYGQEEFQKGIEMYAQAVNGSQPDLEAESAKLGDNANDRIQAASMFANKFFPQESLPAIERMCESHEGILALEAIMEATKDGSFSDGTQPTGQTTQAELDQMMQDPRYWDKNDTAYVKQVEEGFKRLYGG